MKGLHADPKIYAGDIIVILNSKLGYEALEAFHERMASKHTATVTDSSEKDKYYLTIISKDENGKFVRIISPLRWKGGRPSVVQAMYKIATKKA